MLPRHSPGPCLHDTASESGSMLPMNDIVKLTFSETSTIVGTINSLRQSRASGHFDMTWISNGTFSSALSSSMPVIGLRFRAGS